jgi:hypothetical protein
MVVTSRPYRGSPVVTRTAEHRGRPLLARDVLFNSTSIRADGRAKGPVSMVRSGACYKWANCGATNGSSELTPFAEQPEQSQEEVHKVQIQHQRPGDAQAGGAL